MIKKWIKLQNNKNQIIEITKIRSMLALPVTFGNGELCIDYEQHGTLEGESFKIWYRSFEEAEEEKERIFKILGGLNEQK